MRFEGKAVMQVGNGMRAVLLGLLMISGFSFPVSAATMAATNCIPQAVITAKTKALQREARQNAVVRITRINALSKEMHYSKDLYDACTENLGFIFKLAEKVSMSDWLCKTENKRFMADAKAQMDYSLESLSASLPMLQRSAELENMREKVCP